MTCALVKNSSIMQVWDGFPVGELSNGVCIATAGPYPLPVDLPDGAQLIPAVLDADQPGKQATGYDLANSTIIDGEAQIVRTWVTIAPTVPSQIRLLQCKVWLIHNSLKAQVDALIAAQNNAELSIRWEGGTDLKRSEPLLDQIAVQFGKTPSDVDAAFIEMSQL